MFNNHFPRFYVRFFPYPEWNISLEHIGTHIQPGMAKSIRTFYLCLLGPEQPDMALHRTILVRFGGTVFAFYV